MDKAKQELKNGNDYLLRFEVSRRIEDIISQSNRGLIGWGDYFAMIKTEIENGQLVVDSYWNDNK